MRIRLFFLLSSLLLLNCSHIRPTISPTTQAKIEDFTQVYVQGAMNVRLHTGFKHPSVHLQGDPRDLKHVSIARKGYALSINMNKSPSFGPVTAEISGHELTTFNYKGAGMIVGEHLYTRQLDLVLNNRGTTRLAGTIGLTNLKVSGSGLTTINGVVGRGLNIKLKGKPKVQLSGIANINRVSVYGSGNLDLHWVKSSDLSLRGYGSTTVQLAGITERLDVELWDKSRFKGRYLRAKTSFVKTHGHARAEITTINRQHTLALDASDIYYFKNAKFDSNFMGNNGAVLDFGRPMS